MAFGAKSSCCGGGGAALHLSFRRALKPLPESVSFCNFSPGIQLRGFKAFAVVKRSPKRLKYSTPRFTKEGGLLYVEADPSGSDSWKLDAVVDLLKQGAVGVIPTDTISARLVSEYQLEMNIFRDQDMLTVLSRFSKKQFPCFLEDVASSIPSRFSSPCSHWYAIVCDLKSHSAIEKVHRIKKIVESRPLSILCHSFHDIDTYTTGFPRGNNEGLTNIFRVVKHCLPGPYTFILTASKALPRQCIRYGTKTSKYISRKSVGVRIPDDPVCLAILEKMGSPLISTSVRSLKDNEWIMDPVAIADAYEQEGLDFVVAAGIRVADPSTVVDMTGNVLRILRQGKGPKQPWMVTDEDDALQGKESATNNV